MSRGRVVVRRLGAAARVVLVVFGAGRPLSSAVAGLLTVMAVWLRGGVSWRGAAAGGAMWAVTMFGFVVNDVLDFEKDRAAGVRRPIASGALGRGAALVYAGVLLAVAAGLGLGVGAGGGVLAVTVAALLVYTPTARSVPLVKGLYVAALCVLPLYYGAVIAGGRASWGTYAVLVGFVTAREVLMDAHEVAGDERAGMRTIASVMGPGLAWRVSAVAMVLALVALNFTARGVAGRVAAAVSVGMIALVMGWPGVDAAKRIAWSRVPMLAAAVALASG